MEFRDLVSDGALLRAVDDLGWEKPTPIQAKAIPPVKAGRDLVGVAQTGTGKTAAFFLPILEQQLNDDVLRTLVVCPTRELAKQVAEDARALLQHTELWVGEVYGGVPIGPQIRDLRAGFDVLVATPGRLIDHLERGTADLSTVRTLVLDEADRMLDMGFRPQIEAIIRHLPAERQNLLFSATMPHGVHALAMQILKDPEWVEATPDTMAAETVEQVVYSVRPDRKLDLLLKLLDEEDMDQVLVFCRTKSATDLLHARLQGQGVNVGILHGDKDMKQRRRAMDAFAGGRVQLLVATDVAQRGLDIEGISHVINYDVPHDPEDYVHRIGRTGRAGAAGDAITFMTGGELAQIHAIERLLGYGIPRISLEGFDYAGSSNKGAQRRELAPRKRRTLGARNLDDLSEEEREKLFSVG